MYLQIKPSKTLKTSQWSFDPPFLAAHETAAIVGVVVAHPVNPLYRVMRGDGEVQVVYRQQLVDCGALEEIVA